MILVQIEQELSRLENERDQIADRLQELGEEMLRIKTELQTGEGMKRADTGKLLGDVRYWLRASHETEAQIANVRRKQKGLVGDWALDLERARDEIGCRMARLRRCCGAGEFSE